MILVSVIENCKQGTKYKLASFVTMVTYVDFTVTICNIVVTIVTYVDISTLVTYIDSV